VSTHCAAHVQLGAVVFVFPAAGVAPLQLAAFASPAHVVDCPHPLPMTASPAAVTVGVPPVNVTVGGEVHPEPFVFRVIDPTVRLGLVPFMFTFVTVGSVVHPPVKVTVGVALYPVPALTMVIEYTPVVSGAAMDHSQPAVWHVDSLVSLAHVALAGPHPLAFVAVPCDQTQPEPPLAGEPGQFASATFVFAVG
jgi:hypothetical protein